MKTKLKNISILAAFFAAFLFFNNCANITGEGEISEAQTSLSSSIFSNSTNEFIVKVVYEVGATPYTGNIGLTANDTWSVTKTSYKAKTTWNATELIALGISVSPAAVVTSNKATVTVIFLNGLFNGNSQTLGVHFSGYGFAFVFKDVVASVGGTAADQRYVEQSTVVHELGHVIGFVNNGVPLTSSYEDQAHLRHSSNANCVMYWTVESSNTILSSLTNTILGARLNLFEAEVLNDGRAFHP